MKKWIASILCLVMVLTSISALAALPAPDASKKPSTVTVTVTKDSDNYLILKVSDGGKDHNVSGSFQTGPGSSSWTSFTWNEEKKAYVSNNANIGWNATYNYVDVNDYSSGKSIYRQIGGNNSGYRTYVELSESSYNSTTKTRTSTDTYWYAEGNTSVSKTTSVENDKGQTVSSVGERAEYDSDGKLTSSSESETKLTYTDSGRTEERKETSTDSTGSVTVSKSTYVYPTTGSYTYTQESETHNKDGKLTRTSTSSRDKDGNNSSEYIYYNATTGKVTSKTTNKSNYEKGTSSRTEERYTSEGVMTYKYVSSNDGKTSINSTEQYYDDGSLRYKTSNKEVTDGNKTTVTGDRYNSANELVFAINGTRTTDDNGTSRDITYTNASGAKIGWDKYDAKTGKTESKLPYYANTLYTYGTDADYGYSENDYSSSQYSYNGDVKTWREYSYDPTTGKRSELVTNYKGLKIYESNTTSGNGKSTNYWLRTQAPYIVNTTANGATTRSYQSVKGLELKKSVYENGVTKYYNSKGELTYQVENGVSYVNKNGKLEKLDDGLSVMTSNRYNVSGFEKYESIDNGYKETYYDLDKKVTGSFERTSVTKDGTTTVTEINYDENGKVTDKDVTVTRTEETDKASKTTVTRNGILTRVEERVNGDDGITTSTTKNYDDETGLISNEYISTYGGDESTWTSKSYDSKGNLYSVYKSKSQANGEKFQQLDGNEAVTSYGTTEEDSGRTVTEQYWAVGTLREFSIWNSNDLSMPGVYSAGVSSTYDENGGYTYWTERDADGNESTWYYYEGDVVSSVKDVIYNADGSRSTHWQNFNEDGTTQNWYYKDETEDGLYVTENEWDGNSVLLWTKVTEATKEGKTMTTTDPYGNKVVEKEDYATGEYTITTNYAGTDGWKYAFGGWKYIENGEETYGWKNIGGTWYYFKWNEMADSNVALYEYDETKKEDVLTEAYVISDTGAWVSTPGWYANSDGDWSYVLGNGQAATGWQNIDGTWYYFTDAGYMRTGTIYDDGTEYHLNDSGAWIQLNGWLVDENDGHWKHYTNDVKDTGWFYDGGWYYLSGQTGSMVTSNLLEINDEYYFFDENGLMATGWQQKGNTWYYMNADGTLADGWVDAGSTWYYMTEEGMATGWQVIDGNWEYFNEDGTWSYTWGPADQ